MSLYRTFKYPLYATARQARSLDDLFRMQCEVYNAALQERRSAWNVGVSIRRFDQFSQLKDLQALRPDVMRFGVTVARGTLTRLDRSFSAFYRRAKAGKKPGYPRFKSLFRFDTVSYEDAKSWKLKESDNRFYLMGVGHIKIKLHRPVKGTLKTCHIRREGKKWYVLIQCEVLPLDPLPKTGKVAGFDLGITKLMSVSDGTQYENLRYLRLTRNKLTNAQQELARKKKGSDRFKKAKQKVARCHRKVRNQRKDAHHKLSRHLVNVYDTLVFENLMISNMSRSAKGTIETPGTKVAQKAGLNREILAAAWGTLISMIAYKVEETGRDLILVDPRGTSQRCCACGVQQAENRISQSQFRCCACGYEANADTNAAVNILRLGLSQRREKREVETSAA